MSSETALILTDTSQAAIISTLPPHNPLSFRNFIAFSVLICGPRQMKQKDEPYPVIVHTPYNTASDTVY
jgi:hypothetical protein